MRKLLIPAFVVLALMFAGLAVKGTALTVLTEAQAASIIYHGNRNSHIFHQPACRYYNCKNCVVEFSSREQALAAGFRPCKICKP